MNFHAFFSGFQRFKTLNAFINVIKPYIQHFNNSTCWIHFDYTCLCTHLSTLQISPHGTFLADGNTSAIQNTQHKHWECDHHPEYNAQHYCCHRQTATQHVYTITCRLATAVDTSIAPAEGDTYPAADLDESTQSFWPGPKHLRQEIYRILVTMTCTTCVLLHFTWHSEPPHPRVQLAWHGWHLFWPLENL